MFLICAAVKNKRSKKLSNVWYALNCISFQQTVLQSKRECKMVWCFSSILRNLHKRTKDARKKFKSEYVKEIKEFKVNYELFIKITFEILQVKSTSREKFFDKRLKVLSKISPFAIIRKRKWKNI